MYKLQDYYFYSKNTSKSLLFYTNSKLFFNSLNIKKFENTLNINLNIIMTDLKKSKDREVSEILTLSRNREKTVFYSF